MNTGKLNKRITIVTPGTLTQTTIGGSTEGASTQRTVFCSAKQLSMSEQLRNGLQTATASYRFTFRYYSADDITRVKRLIYHSRNFVIQQVENTDEENNEITVIANESK